MSVWKKYDVYNNGQYNGRIYFNSALMKKILSVSLAAFINVSTLTACSFKSNRVEEVAPYVVDDLTFKNIDEEIYSKQYFVDCVFEEVYNNEIEALVNIFMESYKKVKFYENNIDPTNEYSKFLTDEEVLKNKENMVTYLNETIELIEKHTNYKYGTDFLSISKIK